MEIVVKEPIVAVDKRTSKIVILELEKGQWYMIYDDFRIKYDVDLREFELLGNL